MKNSTNHNTKGDSERSGGRRGYANTRRAEKARDAFGIAEEPKKNSNTKRVNFDNTRVSDPKFQAFLKGMRMKDSNDVSWYHHNEEMFKAATSFPSNDIVGANITRFNSSVYVPGIMTLYWEPHLEGNAFTQAMDSMYTFTIHANSRNYDYTAPDQMMMVIAAAEVFRAIANAQRVYGVMKHYNPFNRYLAESLVTALGFNFHDLLANLGDMWFDLNQMIAACEQFWIPDNMPLLERWFWMNSNIYTDANSVKAQIYALVPESFLKLVEDGPTGTMLSRVAGWSPCPNVNAALTGSTIPSNTPVTVTWAQYSSIVWSMINALANSEDRGKILGDLLNAYGAQRIYKLGPVSAEYTVPPTYNPEVLAQIENANAMVAQVSGLVQNPASGTSRTQIQYSLMSKSLYTGESGITVPNVTILNFHQTTPPTGDQVMIATRLKCAGMRVVVSESTGDNPTVGVGPDIAGTEFVCGFGFFCLGANGLFVTSFDGSWQPETSYVAASLIHQWAAFDWAPWFYTVKPSTLTDFSTPGNRGYSIVEQAIGDYDWYTTIDMDELNKLHVTALYSLLGQPENI